jgi:hypothetical protein
VPVPTGDVATVPEITPEEALRESPLGNGDAVKDVGDLDAVIV